jgi:hypothetical protein
MTEPENSRAAMHRNVLADAFGTSDLRDWDVLEQWLAAGVDFWRDVVPTVRSVIAAQRAKEPGWQPGNLRYFTPAIERARIVRVMGLKPNARELGPDEKAEFIARVVRAMDAPEKDDAREEQGDERPTRHSRQAPDPGCACLWCKAPFRPRGATGKRFCSDRCRAAYHRGLRVWAMRAVQEGRLSLEAVRIASREPYTESPEVSRRSGAKGVA